MEESKKISLDISKLNTLYQRINQESQLLASQTLSLKKECEAVSGELKKRLDADCERLERVCGASRDLAENLRRAINIYEDCLHRTDEITDALKGI